MENKKKIQIWVTPKQSQFITFLNEKFKFGKLEITVHASDPQDYSIKEIKGFFTGDMKKGIDSIP